MVDWHPKGGLSDWGCYLDSNRQCQQIHTDLQPHWTRSLAFHHSNYNLMKIRYGCWEFEIQQHWVYFTKLNNRAHSTWDLSFLPYPYWSLTWKVGISITVYCHTFTTKNPSTKHQHITTNKRVRERIEANQVYEGDREISFWIFSEWSKVETGII